LEAALLALVSAAEQEHGLVPLGRTEIRIVECGQDRPLTFTAVVDVRPHIDLPDLTSVVIELGSSEVDGAEIDATLEELRDRLTTVEDSDRAARTGDVVTVEVRAVIADVDLAYAGAVPYEIGSGDLVLDLGPAVVDRELVTQRLDECLVGLTAGGSAAVAAPLLSGRFAGEDATLLVTVVAVKEIRRPALDDAFATRWGDFANLRELREAVRGGLGTTKETRCLQQLRDAALARIAGTVAEPQGVVHDEVEQRRQWMLAEFQRLGTSLAGYLATTGRTTAQLDAELRTVATQKVRSQLALDAVADAEGLGATGEEVGQTIARRASRVGVPADFYYDQLTRAGVLETVIADVRRAKALALVLQRVSIVDSEGRPMTLPAAQSAAEALSMDAVT
jgi:trigger factor